MFLEDTVQNGVCVFGGMLMTGAGDLAATPALQFANNLTVIRLLTTGADIGTMSCQRTRVITGP